MACLLLLVIAATVLTAPHGKQLTTHAARTTSPEAFWRATLPDAPMPESIRELLRPRADANAPNVDDDANVRDGDDPPPPMNFNYDDYKSSPSPSPSPSPRRHAATAAPSAKALEHAGDARRNAAVYVCRGVVGPASAYVAHVVGERGDAATATVVCHAHAVADTSDDCKLEHAAFRLLDVKQTGGGGGGAAMICYAMPRADLLLVVKSDKVPSSSA